MDSSPDLVYFNGTVSELGADGTVGPMVRPLRHRTVECRFDS